jgi:hypothetical protein
MTGSMTHWAKYMAIALGVLVALAVLYRLAAYLLGRRLQRQRVVAARERSAHMPLDIPSARADLPATRRPATQWDPLPGEAQNDSHRVVDEQPRIRIRYQDAWGKVAERVIEVERVDLHQQAVVAKGDSLHDPRIYPLSHIVDARHASTGQPFNLGQWVDAVRIARRRREIREQSQFGALGGLANAGARRAPMTQRACGRSSGPRARKWLQWPLLPPQTPPTYPPTRP